MPRFVACAVVRDNPPQVFIAEDQDTLNWVLALQLISRTRGSELPEGLRDQLRAALRDELWGDAVGLWMRNRPEVDVYSTLEFYTADDVALAAQELEFTPLFED
jgi:hypothetical protein